MRRQGINGDLITKYREENKLTQAKFASRLNKKLNENGVEATYSDKAISMWENGNRQPADINVLKALADMLNVSLDELCGKEFEENALSQNSNDNDINYFDKISIDEVGHLLCIDNDDVEIDYDLSMFNSGKLIARKEEKKSGTDKEFVRETREFWLAITLEPLATDIVFSRTYYWDNGIELFEKYTKGAHIIDKEEFDLYIYENIPTDYFGSPVVKIHEMHSYTINDEKYLEKHKKGYIVRDYIHKRFDIDIQMDELMEDMNCALYDGYGQEAYYEPNSEDVYYTDKGIIIKVNADIVISKSDFIRLRFEHAFKREEWEKINQKSIDELLKAE